MYIVLKAISLPSHMRGVVEVCICVFIQSAHTYFKFSNLSKKLSQPRTSSELKYSQHTSFSVSSFFPGHTGASFIVLYCLFSQLESTIIAPPGRFRRTTNP
jgi:hypothetical protein